MYIIYSIYIYIYIYMERERYVYIIDKNEQKPCSLEILLVRRY